jgi:hypothetical protein
MIFMILHRRKSKSRAWTFFTIALAFSPVIGARTAWAQDGAGDVRIVVGLPNTPDSDVSSGESPFRVVLTINATNLSGTLQSISWDLGDGSTANGLTVPHTYVNETTTSLRIPITALVTVVTSTNDTEVIPISRFITVEPGEAGGDPGDVDDCELPGTCADGPGGTANPCGAGALLPLVLVWFTLNLVRRRVR